MDDLLYTPDEIASKLKITKGTVYEMIKRGELDAHKIGKHLRISQMQYERFLVLRKGIDNVYDVVITRQNEDTVAIIDDIVFFVEPFYEGPAKLSIRPESVLLSKGDCITSARNCHLGKIVAIKEYASRVLVTVDIGVLIASYITKRSLHNMALAVGSDINVIFKTMSIHLFR